MNSRVNSKTAFSLHSSNHVTTQRDMAENDNIDSQRAPESTAATSSQSEDIWEGFPWTELDMLIHVPDNDEEEALTIRQARIISGLSFEQERRGASIVMA